MPLKVIFDRIDIAILYDALEIQEELILNEKGSKSLHYTQAVDVRKRLDKAFGINCIIEGYMPKKKTKYS